MEFGKCLDCFGKVYRKSKRFKVYSDILFLPNYCSRSVLCAKVNSINSDVGYELTLTRHLPIDWGIFSTRSISVGDGEHILFPSFARGIRYLPDIYKRVILFMI
jgi:hypothetical protein